MKRHFPYAACLAFGAVSGGLSDPRDWAEWAIHAGVVGGLACLIYFAASRRVTAGGDSPETRD